MSLFRLTADVELEREMGPLLVQASGDYAPKEKPAGAYPGCKASFQNISAVDSAGGTVSLSNDEAEQCSDALFEELETRFGNHDDPN